jgi:hypothetical protein
MISIEKVDTSSKKQVKEFVNFPFKIYAGVKEWVPPILSDVRLMLNENKHPFYEHSDAEFFTARSNGEILGRIALIENKPSNKFHQAKQAAFYLFESVDDNEVAKKIFDFSFDWVKKRGLNYFLGPKGLSSFDGYGFLVEGFDKRQMMTMMNYNLPNYPRFAEEAGFKKVVDWVSSYAHIPDFEIPEKISEIAKKVESKGKLQVKHFKNKAELKSWANKIGHAYNKAFVNNWEYYPLSDNEIKFALNNILVVGVPDLIKIITYNDEVVGFLLGFPDISAALQKYKGSLSPIAIYNYMRELKNTKWISFNGVGILPEFQGRGGNYLMMSEMVKTAKSSNFEHGELTQIAESAIQMRFDLENLGVKPYKNHRIYGREI